MVLAIHSCASVADILGSTTRDIISPSRSFASSQTTTPSHLPPRRRRGFSKLLNSRKWPDLNVSCGYGHSFGSRNSRCSKLLADIINLYKSVACGWIGLTTAKRPVVVAEIFVKPAMKQLDSPLR